MGSESSHAEELAELVREVQEKVRSRYATSAANGLQLPDLLPLLHARDAAEAKVASIGTVNPRPPGLKNQVIQRGKRTIARALRWFVRDQVAFNEAQMACVQATLEALNENNRALRELAGQQAHLRESLQQEQAGLKSDQQDIRSHWANWRPEWEHKLFQHEVSLLRSVAELQGAFQHRTNLLESNFREVTKAQHSEFIASLERGSLDVQRRLWADLEKVRTEYERLIHTELRLIRQRVSLDRPETSNQLATAAAVSESPLDYTRFAERFRGSEEYVRAGQGRYRDLFEGRQHIVDIGCGRGEFLSFMRDLNVPAHGVDLSVESVAICRAAGLSAEVADLFVYLHQQPDRTLDGLFCSQVVEHLPPDRLPAFIRLAAQKLSRGGVLVIETPNPECLAIFATHFYLDPTHQRPVPPQLLRFYCEEYGLSGIEIWPLSPAADSYPALNELPASVREQFFGHLDYALIARA